jgi:hypothetical protein
VCPRTMVPIRFSRPLPLASRPVVVAPWYDMYEWAAPGVNAEKPGLVPIVGAGKEAERFRDSGGGRVWQV